jgi:MoaA/NifB/PqqE/SkfB family radical SAM enzyme
MRFPLAVTAKIAGHIIKHKLRRSPKFALVLQLEPLHTCNLTCTGCGRRREYTASLRDMMSLEECLASAAECDAPMVSVCGGEPLIYPRLEELVAGLRAQSRIVYICTNGVLLRKKLKEYLAGVYSPAVEPKLTRLLAEELISEEDAETIRQGPADGLPVVRPAKWLYWNVHMDGLERTHDQMVERAGVFRECVAAIKTAKLLGYQVATNTTVYRETDMDEIERMFAFFSWLGVDGHTISPGYDYDAAKNDMRQRLGKRPEDFFLTRALTQEKFARIEEWGRRFSVLGTPVYQEFLAGKRDLTCTAWAVPTRNAHGWRAPCYLMADGHYPTYRRMLEEVDWDKYGVVDGVARDRRCQNCMVHCGYDPSGALGVNYQKGDTWKNIKYNLGPRPKPCPEGRLVEAFDGCSAGKGHLAAARAAGSAPAADGTSNQELAPAPPPEPLAKSLAEVYCLRHEKDPQRGRCPNPAHPDQPVSKVKFNDLRIEGKTPSG